MTTLAPFLYFFQDPATVFAFHLIYTHNVIHWYLLIILFFVYCTMASLLRNFTWNSFNKSRGLQRSFAHFSGFFWIQRWIFAAIIRMLDYGYDYYVLQAMIWTDSLFIFRDDPKSYLYYYYPKQLAILKEIFLETKVPLTVLDEIGVPGPEELAINKSLYLVDKFSAEESYYTLILCTLRHSFRTPQIILSTAHDSLEQRPLWLLHKNLDSYLGSYFSRQYSTQSWVPYQAFLASQKGNDSLPFEYSCVIIPTLIVFIILVHSLSLLYSGSEEITPGLHFTAVGHQWFWSYELEAFIHKYRVDAYDENWGEPKVISLSANFDSIPVAENSLTLGSKRLLEVDNPLVLPIGVPLKALATSGDVLHSWAVPEMGIKIDAVPGRINDSLSFIQRPGIFYGQCSELCGVGHGFMPIVVEAVAVPNFITWAQQREGA